MHIITIIFMSFLYFFSHSQAFSPQGEFAFFSLGGGTSGQGSPNDINNNPDSSSSSTSSQGNGSEDSLKIFADFDPFFEPYSMEFKEFLRLYNKELLYSEQEKVFRQSVFEANVRLINLHNSNTSRLFHMAINEFADLTEEQFLAKYTGLIFPIETTIRLLSSGFQDQELEDDHEDTNWILCANKVHHQGSCGSCYAVAIAKSLTIIARMYSQLTPLQQYSPQQLINCAKTSEIHGCEGNIFQPVLEYVKNDGLSLISRYKYITFIGQPPGCDENQKLPPRIKIQSFQRIKKGDCNKIVELTKRKAIPVGISAKGIRFYNNGCLDVEPPHQINHAVVLLGFNKQKGYLIQNSWGLQWGSQGHAIIHKVKNLGICQYAMQPTFGFENGQPRNCQFVG